MAPSNYLDLQPQPIPLPQPQATNIAYLIEKENSYRLREDGEHRKAFEVQMRFNTGARIEATFPKRAEAIAFLRGCA